MPAALKSIDPAWRACKPFPLGAWDPPRTLSSVSAMDPTTKHIATTTPVASPGISPTPLVTPTASHADPMFTENHDPKNTADPKDKAGPASSKTKEGSIHSAAADQADPAIDQTLGLSPSRTQDPDSHSEQLDPEPGATSHTPHISKATAADDPRGTLVVVPSTTKDPQGSGTADQQASSGESNVPGVPVDLPVFDPMTFIHPHQVSSHRTSIIDPASKTHVTHIKSTPKSAVDAHDTAVGNAIDPAIMSKVVGINNIFGGAAGTSSTALGSEVDPASRSQSEDIEGAGATALAHTTDMGSRVGLASTQRSVGLGSEFDYQETARPYTAATIGAQSSESSESTEQAGSHQSLNGGPATTTRATDSVQYESGSITRGLSAGSSGTGASNPSAFDRLSSSAHDSSHESAAKSETLGSGRTNDILSASNSHEVSVSHLVGISEASMTSAVGTGPQSTDLTNSQFRATARLTSSASRTDTTGSTASTPAPFLGQGTRLLPSSAASAFIWLVASALYITPWIR